MAAQLQRDALEKFLDDGDRSLNPVFVGRDDIIDTIMRKVHRIARHDPARSHRKSPAQGQMQLIQGVPGIGKTSILNTLENRCDPPTARAANHPYVIPVPVINAHLLSHAYVASCIKTRLTDMEQAGPSPGLRSVLTRMRPIVQRLNGLQITGPGGIGAGVSWSPGAAAPAELPDVPQLPPNCAILLMIDEIQTVTPSAKSVLQYLEGGSDGLPILPVLAGLSTSAQILQQAGLSRMNGFAVYYPQPLSRDDVSQAARTFFRVFSLQASPAARTLWTQTIWNWSQGWPAHLYGGLHALGQHVMTHDGLLDNVDRWDVQADAVQQRQTYYRARFGPWQGRPRLIGQAMAALGREGLIADEVEDVLHATLSASATRTRSQEFTTMLRLGLLDEHVSPLDGTLLYECPIPSLRSFAVAQTGNRLHAAAMLGHIQGIRQGCARHDVNAIDAWGRTPLHLAAQNNWPAAVSLLLEHGADPIISDQWGQTPLDVATQFAAGDARDVLSAHRDETPT